MTSRVKKVTLYPGLEALPLISEELYNILSTGSNFPHEISPSVFDYYLAAASYSRLLRLHAYNGGDVSPEEIQIINKCSQYMVPSVIANYLLSFGNLKKNENLWFKFQMLPRHDFLTYKSPETYDGLKHVVRVNSGNHYLYAMYPCLEVYMHRILADMQVTNTYGFGKLQFPLSPDYLNAPCAGMPTQNMLGYKPAARLRCDQLEFLSRCGINLGTYHKERFIMGSIGTHQQLMRNVERCLKSYVVMYKLPACNIQGSETQLTYQVPITEDRPLRERYLDYQFANCSTFRLPSNVCFNSGAYVQRIKRSISTQHHSINPWCVYDFDNYTKVPSSWKITANSARMEEDALVQKLAIRSVPYLMKDRVRHIISQSK